MGGALILIGAPGAGKTSVLAALSSLLESDGVAHGVLEAEQLTRGYPALHADSWLETLEAVVPLQRRGGRDLLLIAATPENERELHGVIAACAPERLLVACLRVSSLFAAARITAREPDSWPGKRALIAHARELASVIPGLTPLDVVIDTDARGAADVARELREAMAPLLA